MFPVQIAGVCNKYKDSYQESRLQLSYCLILLIAGVCNKYKDSYQESRFQLSYCLVPRFVDKLIFLVS